MPLSKARDAERKRIARGYVQPEQCSHCQQATLYKDGRLRCDKTIAEDNMLGACVQPDDKACSNFAGESFKIWKPVIPKRV